VPDRLVLVHGLAGSPRWWRPVLPALREYEVRYVDPREELRAEADDIVVGHSLGGMRAAQYASEHRVRKLVLVDPAGIPSGRWLPLQLLATINATTPSFVPTVAFDALRWGPRALVRHGLEAARGRIDVSNIRAPTLIVWGARDKLVPARLASQWSAAIPHSRLEILPKARHVPMVEQPSAFVQVLLDFLRDGDRSGVVDGVRPPGHDDESSAR
jgi:pimeloyl-ACP methyl ester carboxylesterase